MELDTENKMMDFVRSLKYLVVFPDKKTQIYRSLRDISEDICVDYSTISKKLKNETGDIFISKGTDFIFLDSEDLAAHSAILSCLVRYAVAHLFVCAFLRRELGLFSIQRE